GPLFFEGRGAGGNATASAVIADIVDVARGHHCYPYGLEVEKLASPALTPIGERSGSSYVRLKVVDRPGVLAAVSNAFYQENLSVKSFVQHSHSPGEPVDMVIVTHAGQDANLATAL